MGGMVFTNFARTLFRSNRSIFMVFAHTLIIINIQLKWFEECTLQEVSETVIFLLIQKKMQKKLYSFLHARFLTMDNGLKELKKSIRIQTLSHAKGCIVKYTILALWRFRRVRCSSIKNVLPILSRSLHFCKRCLLYNWRSIFWTFVFTFIFIKVSRISSTAN